MAEAELAFGAEVIIPWAYDTEVRGTVQEVYGPPARRHVIVRLTPEGTGLIVDEPSTVSMPIDAVTRAAPA